MATTDRATPATIDPAEPGSAVRLFDQDPTREHPAEIVLGELLRIRAMDLPDGRTYRLREDLMLCILGSKVASGDVLVPSDLTLSEFLRLTEQMSFNDMYLVGHDRALAEDAAAQAAASARLAPTNGSAAASAASPA
ncbi:hypothetical protein [Longimicrobium terrae]|uniref:Uncharacterized protein n=1 Tax=Longimicrobium terrae TaxID=1639882 RepID=A0A841GRM9_9BACT|nr:hypothetical protein [Longimicrobium terrae]MBB4635886.1 hypothetical protein [Longimicrobium terrae]MBB6070282.1 hypothetical protein [Longimicrobium terrae]NNC30786.1 hypothetical protein [Longimicrobium terrae]